MRGMKQCMCTCVYNVQYIVCNSRWLRRFRIEHFSVTNLSPIKIFSMQKQFSFQIRGTKKTSRWVASYISPSCFGFKQPAAASLNFKRALWKTRVELVVWTPPFLLPILVIEWCYETYLHPAQCYLYDNFVFVISWILSHLSPILVSISKKHIAFLLLNCHHDYFLLFWNTSNIFLIQKSILEFQLHLYLSY